jgi:hypothetical protein
MFAICIKTYKLYDANYYKILHKGTTNLLAEKFSF